MLILLSWAVLLVLIVWIFAGESILSSAMGRRQTVNFDRSKTKRITGLLAAIWVVLVFLSGIYIVTPEKQAIVYTLGKYTGSYDPGLHFKIPFLQEVDMYSVTTVFRSEVGFRSVGKNQFEQMPDEAKMFTKDENILMVEAVVQYKIKNLKDYVFNIDDKNNLIINGAQASLRQVVGNNLLEDILTSKKDQIQSESKIILQQILDKYQAGIIILNIQLQDVQPPEKVVSAFKDVASAREDKIKAENEATGYANSILPTARGEAQRMINEADAYKQKRIKEAEGDVAKFLSMYEKYKLGEDVTKSRLYLETMERILPNIKKVVVDKSVKGSVINIIGQDKTKEIVPINPEPKEGQ